MVNIEEATREATIVNDSPFFCDSSHNRDWGDPPPRTRWPEPLPWPMLPRTPLFFCCFRILEPCSYRPPSASSDRCVHCLLAKRRPQAV